MEEDYMVDGEIQDYREYMPDSPDSDLETTEDVLEARANETKPAPSQEEKVQAIYTRKYLNGLSQDVDVKERHVILTREELNECRARIAELDKEKGQVYTDIQQAGEDGNVPKLDRLRAQHERVIREVESEREIEEKIKDRLASAEYEWATAEVERGGHLKEGYQLQQLEMRISDAKESSAKRRLQKEEDLAETRRKTSVKYQREMEETVADRLHQHRRVIETANTAREKASKYLQETISKARREEKETAERHSADLEKRVTAVLSLKKSVTSTRENIDAILAKKRTIAKEAEEEEKRFRQEIRKKGGNPDTAIHVKKRLEAINYDKSESQRKIRDGEIEIAQKILDEESQFQRRRDMYPHLWGEKEWESSLRVKPHRKKKLRSLQPDGDTGGLVEGSHTEPGYGGPGVTIQGPRDGEGDEEGVRARGDYYSDSSDEEREGKSVSVRTAMTVEGANLHSAPDVRNLAKPEFEGMWDKFERYVVPKEESVRVIKANTNKVSKMDQAIMVAKMEKQRENIVQKQVAAGREFKGRAFNSKPEVILFKDFDVGETYRKRVVLTNVSYSINFCKILGLSDQLKDFIEISFDPPGQLSAGMMCELFISFKPMINEDLEGEINFLSQTGPFSIPIVCSVKRCELVVDSTQVNFGTTVIGETMKRHLVLTNKGALGTSIKFYKYVENDNRVVTTAGSGDLGDDSPGDEKEDVSELSESLHGGGEEFLGPPPGRGDEYISTAGPAISIPNEVDYDGMRVVPSNPLDIAPFTSVNLEMLWNPSIPGKCEAKFILSFEDKNSGNIQVTAVGNALDVPVWVSRQNIDLQICMTDRLYQDSIMAKNRATTALKLTFEVPYELRPHMEVLPRTGFVQAGAEFSAQLKFLPRASLARDAPQYFDVNTGVLEVPLMIRVADQTRPVPFVIHAVVTNSDLSFNTKKVDFGYTTIHESVIATVQLTNHSILPQEFGFVDLPEYVEVQPNDGFGTILPLESVDLEVIFSPPKAKSYQFELTCKSLINRDFKIKCKGVGVHPPIELSHQVIHFAATSLYDYSIENLAVINNHQSTNEFTHPVPRIGTGEIAPVGPTSFEFVVPDDCPLTIYPSVGTVQPGDQQRIQVRFGPTLSCSDIKEEAVKVKTRKLEDESKRAYEEMLQREKEEVEALQKKKGAAKPKLPSAKGKAGQAGTDKPTDGPEAIVTPTVDEICTSSDEYAAAQSLLTRQFEGCFESFTIPCYVASGACKNPGELNYSVHNTLYLHIHCPAVRPKVVVISDRGRSTADYGDISIGQMINKTVTIQNLSDETFHMTSSLLDTTGPFEMRNAIPAEIEPDETHPVVLRFAPMNSKVFHETFHIYSPQSTLHINLLGRGVSPTIDLEVEGQTFDMGKVLPAEFVEKTFKIKNTSSLSVEYKVHFDSLSPHRYKESQHLPQYIHQETSKKHTVGVQNLSGACVFDCAPYAGCIAAGEVQEITLTFAPDHASDLFRDRLHVVLFNLEESYSFDVVGQCKSHAMYLMGGEALGPDVQSLLPLVTPEPDEDVKTYAGTMVLMFYSVAEEGVFHPAKAMVTVGSVKSMMTVQKKNGEFIFENLTSIANKGFTIAEPKGSVEPGAEKEVEIVWTPPESFDPNNPMEATLSMIVKNETAENYQLHLRGLVVSNNPQQPASSADLIEAEDRPS